VIAVKYTCFILATIAGGIAADRIGKKTIFILACLCAASGAACCGAALHLPAFFAGTALLGMGGGILESMSSALLSDLYPHRRKLMLNLSQVGYCVGAIAGPMLIGRLMPSGVSWRAFFLLLMAMASALLVIYALSRIPRTPAEKTIDRKEFKAVIGRWSFLCPCLIIFLYVFSESGAAAFMNVFLRKYREAPENWAIYGISIFWTTMTLGRILCAAIPERVSYEKLIALLMLAAGITLAVQAIPGHWAVHLVFFALTGFAFAGTWPFIIGLTAMRNPGFSGTVVGLTVAGGAVGCVLAPPVVGALLLAVPPGLAMALLSLPLFLGAALALSMGKANDVAREHVSA
jgi:fucose permease